MQCGKFTHDSISALSTGYRYGVVEVKQVE